MVNSGSAPLFPIPYSFLYPIRLYVIPLSPYPLTPLPPKLVTPQPLHRIPGSSFECLQTYGDYGNK